MKDLIIPNLPKDYSDAEQLKLWMSGIQKIFKQKNDADAKTEKLISPVGSWYVQYPSAKSDDEDTAFPESERPATLFGGTWTEMYGDEGIFFRTFGESEERTDGLQMDAMQRITGTTGNAGIRGSGVTFTGVGVFYDMKVALSSTGENNLDTHRLGFDSSRSVSPNTAKTSNTETRGKNRLKKVWYREA